MLRAGQNGCMWNTSHKTHPSAYNHKITAASPYKTQMNLHWVIFHIILNLFFNTYTVDLYFDTAVICLRVVWWCSTLFIHFTLNYFTVNIMLHWNFCSCCCIGWIVGSCAWQSSLWRYDRARAWLQSTSIFISLICFHVCCFLHVDQQMHTHTNDKFSRSHVKCFFFVERLLVHTASVSYGNTLQYTLRHKVLIPVFINLELTLCCLVQLWVYLVNMLPTAGHCQPLSFRTFVVYSYFQRNQVCVELMPLLLHCSSWPLMMTFVASTWMRHWVCLRWCVANPSSPMPLTKCRQSLPTSTRTTRWSSWAQKAVESRR